MNNPYGVKVGQVWQDWDGRFRSQTPVYKKVLKVDCNFAYCKGIKNGILTRRTRISLKRFKPNSTGYKLVKEDYKKIG